MMDTPFRCTTCHGLKLVDNHGAPYQPFDTLDNRARVARVLGAVFPRLCPDCLGTGIDLGEYLGQIVRETWVTWAHEQINPKGSWLLAWHELSEAEREVDRRIGLAVYKEIMRLQEQNNGED